MSSDATGTKSHLSRVEHGHEDETAPARRTGIDSDGGVGVATPNPHTEQELRAADLREEAFAACGAGKASVCKAKLDEAKTLDPKGEEKPDVVKAAGSYQGAGAAGRGMSPFIPREDGAHAEG